MAFMNQLFVYLTAKAEAEEGQGMVEYALIIVGIAIVVGIAVAALGGRIETLFDGITF